MMGAELGDARTVALLSVQKPRDADPGQHRRFVPPCRSRDRPSGFGEIPPPMTSRQPDQGPLEEDNHDQDSSLETNEEREVQAWTKRERAIFEVNLVLRDKLIRILPNVHLILAASASTIALTIAVLLMEHNDVTTLHIAEILHMLGWLYLEIQEVIFIEEL